MEYLPNDFSLEIPSGTFPLTTDSMALAHFARLPKHARVLDLGSGCGTLGLVLCATDPSCTVLGVELDEAAHAAAQNNIRRNGLEDRMDSVCADLCGVSGFLPAGHYSCVISNPPYFSGGPASRQLPLARQEITCPLAELMASAAYALKFGGDFFLVHKPERLAEIITEGSKHSLETKRLRLLRNRENGPVVLILLQLRKGAKPGLILDENALFDPQGNPTDYYREVYHL